MCQPAPATSEDIDAFICLVQGGLCSLGGYDVTFTQQTQQSPANPVNVDDNITFTVEVQTNTECLSYQWQRDGFDLTGETQSSLTLTEVQLCDAGTYRCVVGTPCDSQPSTEVTLLVDLDTEQDCNENGFPDECDIADNISLDEDENGIPDECEGMMMMMGMNAGTPDLSEQWESFYDWYFEQDWSSVSGSERFSRIVAKLEELGLPVERPW
jgi:hypothetical protein